MKNEIIKEYDIKNKHGKIIFTIKLIDGKSHIFIGDKPIRTCRFLPLPIHKEELPKYKYIESINDIIDQMDTTLERKESLSPEYAELDFLVNCSNLEAWVLHDFDTRLLDYRLCFPLLEEMAENGDPIATLRFKEELLIRYNLGNKDLREYLNDLVNVWLSEEERLSVLPEDEREALISIKKLSSKTKSHVSYSIEKGHVIMIAVDHNYEVTKEESLQFQKLICKLKYLKELGIIVSYDTIEKERPVAIPELGSLNELEDLGLYNIDTSYIFDAPLPFPSLKKLEAFIPPTISKIKSLIELETWGDDKEEITVSIGDLPNLKKLIIRKKVCTLPESIGNLENLSEIEITGKNFTSLPESFGKLKNLHKLKIWKCELISLPESFGGLKRLRKIEIERCRINRLPESIGELNNLEYLNLSENNLSKLPASFSKLTKLKILDLSKNQILEFPIEITSLKNLEILTLDQNKLTVLPKKIGNLKNLKRLSLRNNEIISLPNTIENLESLISLNIGMNQLSNLLETIKNLKKIEKINLINNQIYIIPEEICHLQSLKNLGLDENPIKELPKCLRTLKHLEWITIANTQIPPHKMESYKKFFRPIEIDDETLK